MKQQEQNNRESLYEADHKTNREQQFRVHSSTVGWQNSKQENRNRNKPLVSSSKKAKQKCSISFFFIPFFVRLSLCLHACVIKGVVKQQQGFYFPPMLLHPVCVPSIPILCGGLISLILLFTLSFPLHAWLSPWRLHEFWFNQTCLWASPGTHGFWSASQSSWASAWLSCFVIYFPFALPYHTRRVFVLMSSSTSSAALYLNTLYSSVLIVDFLSLLLLFPLSCHFCLSLFLSVSHLLSCFSLFFRPFSLSQFDYIHINAVVYIASSNEFPPTVPAYSSLYTIVLCHCRTILDISCCWSIICYHV